MEQPLDKTQRNFWEKDHLPNLTGTPYAHKPKGLKGLIVRKVYEPWTPPEQ
jgi:NADH:ubiquinone oxidoreductase subunit